MRSIRNKIMLGMVALVFAGIGASRAQAQFSFATFSNNSISNFRYDSSSNQFFSATSTTFSSIPINFRYNIDTLYGPAFTNITATLTFQAFGGASVDVENALPLTGINMVITANTPGVLGSNLLSLSSSTGRIRGTNNSNSIPVSGDTSLGNTVSFSSDYLDFSDETLSQKIFALTTSDASPNYSINPDTNRPQSFGATYIGSFSSQPAPQAIAVAVPEANTMILVGSALSLTGAFLVRRRRK